MAKAKSTSIGIRSLNKKISDKIKARGWDPKNIISIAVVSEIISGSRKRASFRRD